MKTDVSIWDNNKRMRTTIKSLATMLLLLAATNGYYMYLEKHYVILAINIIYGILVVPIFISKAKYDKNPPKQYEK